MQRARIEAPKTLTNLAQHLISRRLALNSDDAIRRGAHKKRSPVYRRDRASTSCRRCADPVIRAAPLTGRCDAGSSRLKNGHDFDMNGTILISKEKAPTRGDQGGASCSR